MKLVVLLILGALFSTSIMGQDLQQILVDASEVIRYKLPDNSSMKVETSYFDFKSFNKSDIGEYQCDLYYQDDNLIELQYSLNNERDYRIFFYHFKSYIFYNVYVQNIGGNNFFAPGFFMYNKKNQRNVFIGFTSESLSSLSLNLDLKADNIDWRFRAIDLKSINRIIEVDGSLQCISGLTTKDSELLTYSMYDLDKNALIEEVHVYSSKSCEETTLLTEMSLDDVYTHLKEGFCNPSLIFKSHPRLTYVDFLWGDLFREYD